MAERQQWHRVWPSLEYVQIPTFLSFKALSILPRHEMCVSLSPEPSSVAVGWIFLMWNRGLVCVGVSECPEVFQCTFEMVIQSVGFWFFSPSCYLVQYIQYKCNISSIKWRNEMKDITDLALKVLLAPGVSSSLNWFVNWAEKWKWGCRLMQEAF